MTRLVHEMEKRMSMKRLEALIEVAGRGWDEWEMEDDGTHDQDTMNAAKEAIWILHDWKDKRIQRKGK